MLRTSVVQPCDLLARTPMPVGAGAPGPPPTDHLPTRRVPVAAPAPLPVAAHPLATTPPPLDDLRLSVSVWSADTDDDVPAASRAPRVGDTVLGFRLVTELGRGAFARVFLAHQEALADRPVALKVTLRPTREAERLARLQHTNVVPVYSVHDQAPVQLICMPYLGRVTLADLIRAYRVDLPARQGGRRSTSARAARTTALNSKNKSEVKSATDSKGRSGTVRAPVWTWSADEPPPIVGEPRAVLEVVAQLAAGLAHAHGRGILHLDLKPANVLLADTGEPMLLDFNLSFDAARPDRELVGGTIPYMAIEQLLDMRARGKGTVDGRTDLYSLGVLAFELLTGAVPFPVAPGRARDLDAQVAARKQGPPALRPLNPDVTPAVEAIVRKLLAADPDDRYQTADELRADIELHLADRPLVHARDGSARERFRKWRRRNPGVPARLAAACVIGLALGLGGAVQRRAEATARYEAVERARATHAALDAARLDLVLPGDPKARARGVKGATELLAGYDLPGGANWDRQPDVRRLTATERAALAGDLGELMLLLAQTKWDRAAGGPDAERRALVAEAWKLNAAARACFGDAAPPFAARQAAALAPAAGEAFEAPPDAGGEPTPRDLFLDAAAALAKGRYAEAAPLLDRVIAARPGHAAAQFCLAFCRQQAGQFQRALERYDVARVLLPTDPRPAHHRGVVYGLLLDPAKAEAEFARAIALDPEAADAHRNRALARYRVGTAEGLAGAEADLAAALRLGAPPLLVHTVRAKVRTARGDRAGAAADAAAAKEVVVETEEDFLYRGWARIDTDPKGALADFDRVLVLNPRSLPALQNKAHVLAGDPKGAEAALAAATRAADLYPEFAPAVASRAVLLARLGRREAAHREIDKARHLSDDPNVLFQAACVYALTSGAHADDRAKALAALRDALKKGARPGALTTNRDLDALRDSPEFGKIVDAATTLW